MMSIRHGFWDAARDFRISHSAARFYNVIGNQR
jgi:hypothetical protein